MKFDIKYFPSQGEITYQWVYIWSSRATFFETCDFKIQIGNDMNTIMANKC